MKRSINKKHIGILLSILLVVCVLIGIGTVLAKYMADKVVEDDIYLTIEGTPKGNVLLGNGSYDPAEDGDGFVPTAGFALKMQELLGGSTAELKKIVFATALPDGMSKEDAKVDVSHGGKGKIFAYYNGEEQPNTVYVVPEELPTDGISYPMMAHANATAMFAGFQNLETIEGLNCVYLDNITDANNMFLDCRALTAVELSHWTAEKLTDMHYMFAYCDSLKSIDLTSFNTANVTQMYSVFSDCDALESIKLDTKKFVTSKVESMSGMFGNCPALTEVDVSGFDTSSVTDMSYMFSGCYALEEIDVSGFNTSNVEYMYGMFSGAAVKTLDLSGFDTGGVTNMSDVFLDCTALTSLDLTGWDTSNVTDMSRMFAYCTSLTELDLSGFDTSNVTTMWRMFLGCSALSELDLSYFDTSLVTDMSGMFESTGLTKLNIAGWNTESVTNMSWMFQYSTSLTYLDLSSFNTANVTTMYQMFNGCSSLKAIFVGDTWSTDSLVNAEANDDGYTDEFEGGREELFTNCSALVGGKGTAYATEQVADCTYARVDAPDAGAPGYLTHILSQTIIEKLAESLITEFTAEAITKIQLGGFTEFGAAAGVTADTWDANGIILDVNGDGTIKGFLAADGTLYILSKNDIIVFANKNSANMFHGLEVVTEIAGLDFLNTFYAETMYYMFCGCKTLGALELSGFDTRNVTNMEGMFANCHLLIELDLSGFDTRNVTNMKQMFWMCMGLKSLTVLGFDTREVTDMYQMFYGCDSLTELDISSFDTSKAEDIRYMFRGCPQLVTVYVSSSWSTESVTDPTAGVFNDCTSIVGEDGTVFDEDHVDAEYARIDDLENNRPGYFTEAMAILTDGSSFQSAVSGILGSNSKVNKIELGQFSFIGKELGLKWSSSKVYLDKDNQGLIRAFTKGDTLYILSENYRTIYANENCANMFSNFTTVTEINGLDKLNTVNVTDMSYMFFYCTALTELDLSNFDTSKVTSMSNMFASCESLTTLDLTSFNTEKVVGTGEGYDDGMMGMFSACYSLTSLDLSSFNVENCLNLSYMFDSCYNLKVLDLSSFKPNSSANVTNMFGGAYNLKTIYASESWDYASMTESIWYGYFYTFMNNTSLVGGNGSSYLDRFTGISSNDEAYRNKTNLVIDGELDENGNVKVGYFTEGPYFLVTGSDFNAAVKGLAGYSGMTNIVFGSYNSLKDTLTEVDWDNGTAGTDYVAVDKDGEGLIRLYTLGNTVYVVSKGAGVILANPDSSNMFQGMNTLTAIGGLDKLDTRYVQIMSNMFMGCTSLGSLDLSGWDTGKVRYMSNMFASCSLLSSLDLSDFVTDNVLAMANMFMACGSLTELDLSSFDTGNVMLMSRMFQFCAKLETIKVGGGWSMESVTDSATMFGDCGSIVGEKGTPYDAAHTDGEYARIDGGLDSNTPGYLTEITVKLTTGSDFNGKVSGLWNIIDAEQLYNYSSAPDTFTFGTFEEYGVANGFAWTDSDIYVDAKGEGTIRVFFKFIHLKDSTEITNLYPNVYILSQGGTEIYANEDSSGMFKNMWYIYELVGLDAVDTSLVTNMSEMFRGVWWIPYLDLSSWDTSSVTDMSRMFYGVRAIDELDLSGWDVSNVTDMTEMFYGEGDEYGIITIYTSGSWEHYDFTDTDMFKGSMQLVGGNGTTYDENFVDKTYARVDGYGVKGYFTLKYSEDQVLVDGASFNSAVTGLDNYSGLTGIKFGTLAEYGSAAGVTADTWESSGIMLDEKQQGTIKGFVSGDTFYVLINGYSSFFANENSSQMFKDMTAMTEISGLEKIQTYLVTDMSSMFSGDSALEELNLTGWATASVTDMTEMFNGCSALHTVYASVWNTDNVTASDNMFAGCTVIEGNEGTVYDENVVDKTYACQDKAASKGVRGYFTDPNSPGAALITTGKTFLAAIGNLFSETVTKLHLGTYNDVAAADSALADAWNASTVFVDADGKGYIRVFTVDDTVYVLSEEGKTLYANPDSSYMFAGYVSYNDTNLRYHLLNIEGLDRLNTSRVENMSYMFYYANVLTALDDISKWDTSNVTNMMRLLSNCNGVTTTLDLSKWDTSKVTTMFYMFSNSSFPGLEISTWDTGAVQSMDAMFNSNENLTTLDLSGWDTGEVTSMSYMFDDCTNLSSIEGISNFDTGNVTSISGMFGDTAVTSLDLSAWDTSNVERMAFVFVYCSKLTKLNLTGWDTGNVTNMQQMFDGCTGLSSLDFISEWDVSQVTTMYNMFNDCISLTSLDLSKWDTGKLENLWLTFSGCDSLTHLDLSGFNTSSVTDMRSVFSGCNKLISLNLSGWDVSNVTDMGSMFRDCPALETIYVTETWIINDSAASSGMFQGCTSLVGGEGTAFDSTAATDKTYAKIDRAKSVGETEKGYLTDGNVYLKTGTEINDLINSLFSETVTKLQIGSYDDIAASDTTLADAWNNSTAYADVGGLGTIRVFASGDTVYLLARGCCRLWANADSSYMFAGRRDSTDNSMKTYLYEINGLTELNTSKVTTMESMFYYLNNVTVADVSAFDTSSVLNMKNMFAYCKVLTTLDVTGFDTADVTDMSYMFCGCSGLTSLTVTGFDTGNVTDMSHMFDSCSGLTELDLSSFDTSQVTTMRFMFNICTKIEKFDLSSFDTTNVKDMNSMFASCESIKEIDLSCLETENVEDMGFMFYNCTALERFELSFSTKSVTNMWYMFCACAKLTDLDLSGIDTSNVTNMTFMFDSCTSLTELDLSSFDTAKVEQAINMFNGCSSLKTIVVGSAWDLSRLNESYSVDMFKNCTSLVGGAGTPYDSSKVHNQYAHVDGGTADPGYLTAAPETLAAGADFNSVIADMFSESVTRLEFGTYDEIVGTDATMQALWDAGTYADAANKGYIRVFTVADTNGDGTEDDGTVYVVSISSSGFYANPDASYMFSGSWYNTENSIAAYLTEIAGLDCVNTAKTTQMQYMFYHCEVLKTLDGISTWNTSKVTDMCSMFYYSYVINALDGITGWDTSSVTDMSFMFYNCRYLKKLNLSGWDTSNVTDMNHMFAWCSYSLAELNLSGWNTSAVKDMNNMFSSCGKLTTLDLTSFDTSLVDSMYRMFYECNALTKIDGITGFDTSKVTNMGGMFYGCYKLAELDLSSFDTSSVTGMTYMFYMCQALTELDLSNFNTSGPKYMTYMFGGCSSLTTLDLSGWDINGVASMGYMFRNCKSLTEIVGIEDWTWTVGTSTNQMHEMFYNCSSLTELDLTRFDTSNVTNMTSMFYGCSSLTRIYVSELWTTDAVESSDTMFYNCSALIGGEGTSYSESYTDSTYARIDKALTDGTMGYLTDPNAPMGITLKTGEDFNDAVTALIVDGVTKMRFGTYNDLVSEIPALTEGWNTAATYVDVNGRGIVRAFVSGDTVYVMSADDTRMYANSDSYHMFYYLSTLTEIIGLDKLDTSKVTNMGHMFAYCKGLTELDLSSFDTSSVTSMIYMFSHCENLQTLDLSGWKTSLVEDMSCMFICCYKLEALDLSSFDTSKVWTMSSMFRECHVLIELDLSGFDISSLFSVDGLVRECFDLETLILPSGFVTDKVSSLTYMFYKCESLQTLDLSDWDVSGVQTASHMFSGCTGLTKLDLFSGWDTEFSNISVAYMFSGCTGLTELDLSGWDTSRFQSMTCMFTDCTNLNKIYVSEGWTTARVQYYGDMFAGCTALVGGEGTAFATAGVTDYSYAKIDGGENDPGYFTAKE